MYNKIDLLSFVVLWLCFSQTLYAMSLFKTMNIISFIS
jgi:hypothetical protein